MIFKIYLMFFVVFALPAMGASITGTVTDSANNQPIDSVYVSITSPFSSSAWTNASGYFSLPIIGTGIIPRSEIKAPGFITYHPENNSFSADRGEKIILAAYDAEGKAVPAGCKLSPGNYFLAWRGNGAAGVFKFLNSAGRPATFALGGGDLVEKKDLAKTMAAYLVKFSAPNYRSDSLSASAGQNVLLKLAHLPAVSQNSTVNVKMILGVIDTAKVTVSFPQ